MPCGYFDDDAVAALAAFQRQALRNREHGPSLEFSNGDELTRNSTYTWREPAVRIYANWMSYLAEHKYHGRSRRSVNGNPSPICRHFQRP